MQVITISNAVCIDSTSCKIPIEVGVMQFSNASFIKETAILEQDTNGSYGIEIAIAFGDGNIQKIGVSTPEKPFFIPLWIDLQFRDTQIFIWPLSNINKEKYRWSLYNILHYSQDGNKEMNEQLLSSYDIQNGKKDTNRFTNWFGQH